MFVLEFTYRFETAHRFTQGSSKCTTPHGHTWRATLGFSAPAERLQTNDMIEDFESLKSAWRQFLTSTVDHSFLLHHLDPIRAPLEEKIPGFRGLIFPGDPTTELIAGLFLEKAISMRPSGKISPEFVLVEETPTNRLRFTREGREAFQAQVGLGKKFQGWWEDSDPASRRFSSLGN